jgi:uncharacterized repeat protein (TIGR03803 family)
MKTHIKNQFLMPLLITALGLMPAGHAPAQTFTTLHHFTALVSGTNNGGASPRTVILSGNTLYGTARSGGSLGKGTVFAISISGIGFTNLHNFSGSGGASPNALILSGNTLYATTYVGGGLGGGSLFAINTDGMSFTNLHNFSGGSDGAYPEGSLVLSGDTLYGTASQGGSGYYGTVFAINTNGTGITSVYGFIDGINGGTPVAGLVLSGNTLYGTTYDGGSMYGGMVFAADAGSAGITNLHSFSSFPNDGYWPVAGLILSGNTLYGTASSGGDSDKGTVFAVNTDGTGFTNLYSFTGGNDGAYPSCQLTLSGNTLYGTASYGGSSGNGTVFAVNTNGTGFTNLYSFTATPPYPQPATNSDGALPGSSLILSGNTLYGTATGGGNSGSGTVFSLSLAAVTVPSPKLTIIVYATNVVLTWPTNATGFILQSTTNLVSPVWITVPGQNTVTNSISGIQKFYRLSQ